MADMPRTTKGRNDKSKGSLSHPLRIAHIMGKMMAGGVEATVMNYYRNINKAEIQFDFIIDEDSTVVPRDEIKNLGGRVIEVPPYRRPLAYRRALIRLFHKNEYHIVHSHLNALSVFPLSAAKRAGVPVRIAHNHSTAGKGDTKRNIMKYMLRPFSRVFPTHFCACTEHAGRWLFGNKLFDAGKVKVVHNAIDLTAFKFDAQARKSLRAELGISDKLVAGHVGRFMTQKNHTFLVDVFAKVHSKNPNSVLLLVGEGELESQIRNKIARLNLVDAVRFIGVRDDVYKFLSGMDILLFPSLYEGLGMAVIEAQAAGLHVIASDRVPPEAKLTEKLEFLSLDSPSAAEEWATKVPELPLYRRDISPADAEKIAGYDITAAAAKLESFYKRISNMH